MWSWQIDFSINKQLSAQGHSVTVIDQSSRIIKLMTLKMLKELLEEQRFNSSERWS